MRGLHLTKAVRILEYLTGGGYMVEDLPLEQLILWLYTNLLGLVLRYISYDQPVSLDVYMK